MQKKIGISKIAEKQLDGGVRSAAFVDASSDLQKNQKNAISDTFLV